MFGGGSFSENTYADVNPNDQYGYQNQGMSQADIDNAIANRSGITYSDTPGAYSGVPMLASGGIVMKPTLAVVGEAGPEAVVPLNGSGLGGGTVEIHLDGRRLASVVVPHLPGEIKKFRLA